MIAMILSSICDIAQQRIWIYTVSGHTKMIDHVQ